MLKEIGTSYMSDDAFTGALMRLKSEALFGNRKMGHGDGSNALQERLERDLDGLQATLKQANEKNKTAPPVVIHQGADGSNGINRIVGSVLGGAVGGPVGAVPGGILGGLF